MSKEELIQELKEGKEVILQGEFSDGENTWNYEYWRVVGEKFQCSYDGNWSHWFDSEDLECSFNPEEAEEIEVR